VWCVPASEAALLCRANVISVPASEERALLISPDNNTVAAPRESSLLVNSALKETAPPPLLPVGTPPVFKSRRGWGGNGGCAPIKACRLAWLQA
jgi:hypothetical protein